MNWKEEIQMWSACILVGGMFVFVILAIRLNLQDAFTGSHSADGVNFIGWCLVPIMFVVCLIIYKNIVGSKKEA